MRARSIALTDLFPDTAIFVIEEEVGDPLGSIGILLEMRDGGVALSDGMVPRVRRFDASGRQAAEFGAYGEGPRELHAVRGLAEDKSGRLLVIDPALGRVTILDESLELDTTVLVIPSPRGPAFSWGDSIVVMTSSAPRSAGITLMTEHWQPLWSVPSASPGSIVEYPYWNSVGLTLMAVSPTNLFTAFSLQYPIHLYNRRGVLVDSLPEPPTSFRRASVPKRGAFAGPGADARFEAWQSSFDVIANLSVVADTLLVVTHGRAVGAGTTRRENHKHIDIYHLPSRSKIFENLILPEGALVLAGGSALYVLIEQPPDPWTLMRVDLDT